MLLLQVPCKGRNYLTLAVLFREKPFMTVMTEPRFEKVEQLYSAATESVYSSNLGELDLILVPR